MKKTKNTKLLKAKSNVKTDTEPDFRTNPSGWVGWNMRVYGNSFEGAKNLLYQRLWLNQL